jgi:hypothetical protein
VVVDGDVDVLPANGAPAVSVLVDPGSIVVLLAVADAPAGTTVDAAELLDVDVDELARLCVLVADWLLEPDPAELAHPVSLEHDRDGRQRHPQRLGDLGRRHPQLPQRHDHRDPVSRCAVSDPPRRRRPVRKPCITFEPVAANPLPSAAHADPGGLGRRRQRPTFDEHAINQNAASAPAESGVTVQLHPGPPMD